MKHSSFLAVFPAPLRKPPSPSNPLRVPRSKASTNRKVLTPQQNFTLGFIQKKTVVSTIVQITIERKKRKHHHPNPRQGVPHLAEAFVLCPAVLQPLPFRDGHGSFLTVSIAPLTRPALPTPIPQASSRCSTSCSSRQPHKACCCHSPLRSLTGVANANELPQLLLRSAT